MKNIKRNVIVVIVLLFVGAAVYLNWSYNSKEANVSNIKNQNNAGNNVSNEENINDADAGLFFDSDENNSDTAVVEKNKKLDAIRLKRQQARDEAKSTLQTISAIEGASKEAIDAATAEVTELANISVLETELESKIIAKGYSDCVVYISEGGVNVTVAPNDEKLNASSVAQLTDIIMGNSEYTAVDIKISEIK